MTKDKLTTALRQVKHQYDVGRIGRQTFKKYVRELVQLEELLECEQTGVITGEERKVLEEVLGEA